MGRSTRWLIFAPVAILALFSTVTNAEPIEGLNTTYYVIDETPPVQSTTEYEECGSELENNINRSYDGEPYEDCTGDLFMVHMTGFIEIPEHDTIEFFLASDDGGEITIGNNTFGVWQDQGCSATMSGNLQLDAGSQPLEVWMYENSGGSCLMLAWKIDDNQWEIVPDEAFTTSPNVSTTTSEMSTTTEASTTSSSSSTTTPSSLPTTTTTNTTTTTSTLPETTTTTTSTSTSLSPTTTMLEVEPTMPEQSTTSSTTTTSLVVETTTTTELVSPPVAQPPVVVQPEPIEEPATEDTEPIQEPEEPVEETLPLEPPDTEPEKPNTTESPDDTLPFVEDTDPDFVDEPDFEEPVIDIPIPDTPPDAPEAPLSDETIETLLTDTVTAEALTEALDELTPEQAEQVIEAILEEEPTQEQATAIASSPAALAVLTTEQATEVFEALDVTELDNTQLEALAEAVTDAPTEVKEAFEDSVDIFSEGLGTYVPVDSKIPVSQRQTLIAIAAGATLTAASTRMRR
jgi:hypothetical protein